MISQMQHNLVKTLNPVIADRGYFGVDCGFGRIELLMRQIAP